MKKYLLLVLLTLLISGCGVEWFPSNTTTTASPSLSMLVNPSTIAVGATSGLTFTIVNASGSALTGLGFSDTLPAGLTASVTSPQCGGTVTATGTATSGMTLSFAAGTLAAGATSCTVVASVTGSSAGSYTLNSASITGLGGGLVNNATNQTLTVTNLSLLISPNPTTASAGSTLTYTITNNTGNPVQSGLGFTAALPTGLTVSTATTSQCGVGTVTATGTATTGVTLSFAAGAIATGTPSCTITANVTGAAGGYSFTKANISGLTSGLINGTTDQTLTIN